MHELTRRAYLESMGIDSYVSRAQLPGAAPSQRLMLVRQPASPSPEVGQSAVRALATGPASVAKDQGVGKSITQRPEQTLTPAKRSAPVPSFSIATIACGGWLWAEELSSEALSRDQVHLIRAMARALGLDDKKVDVSQFNWPIHRNAQLDLGEDAARAGLHGFVQRRLEQQQCVGVILLGSACRQRLGESTLDVGRCVRTLGTAQMLLDPVLKKQAWRDLLPIVSGS